MATQIEVSGYDELTKALEQLSANAQANASIAMQKSCLAVLGILKEPPEETAANKPGRLNKHDEPMPYYERNRGTWWPSKKGPPPGVKFGKANGIVKNKKSGVIYKLDPTSEQLGKSWSIEIKGGSGELVGVVGTDVTYAPDVQGSNQEPLFAKIGWVKIDDAVTAAEPDIQAAFQEAVDKLHW